MSERENMQVVQRVYECFKIGDIPALLGLVSDDVAWKLAEIENVPFAGARTGRAAVAEFFRLVNENEEFTQFEPQEFIAQGSRVVVLGHFISRARKTGKSYASDWAHVFAVRDGKITSFQEYMDTAAVSNAFSAQTS